MVFEPKPGKIDYTHARWAPVVNCVVKHGDKILIVQRIDDLNFYPGSWNGISGFLDDGRSLEEKVRDELSEEVGIAPEDITSIRLGAIFDQEAPELGKTWIVHPVLAEVTTDQVQLDWEAQGFRWVTPEEVETFNLLPGFNRVIRALFDR